MTTAEEVENKFRPRGVTHGGILLLAGTDALALVEAAREREMVILGVDGFHLADGVTQPTLDHRPFLSRNLDKRASGLKNFPNAAPRIGTGSPCRSRSRHSNRRLTCAPAAARRSIPTPRRRACVSPSDPPARTSRTPAPGVPGRSRSPCPPPRTPRAHPRPATRDGSRLRP